MLKRIIASALALGYAASIAATPARAMDKGDTEVQVLTGYATAPYFPLDEKHDRWSFWRTSIRAGYVFADWDNINLESLVGLNLGNISQGWGTHICGLDANLRANYEPDSEKWRIYAQAGVGVMVTDAYKSSTNLTQSRNYSPQFMLGGMIRIREGLYVGVEAGHLHYSNNGEQDRNPGTDSFVGSVFLSASTGRVKNWYDKFKSLFQ